MNFQLSPESQQVMIAFGCYLVGVLALGIVSHRYLKRGSFVKEYFLGNRGLGPWVLALTIAATAISGGTFMGFPSLIYTNGWIMALWIASYMVVPITTMALLGKRLNQVGRIAGSVTVPDVLRDRFQSPTFGLISTCLILLFLTFNLVAQFKGGGLVMAEALRLPPAKAQFQDAEAMQEKLVLRFLLPDGSTEVQRTPLPSTNARYLPNLTKQEGDHVQVYFSINDATVAKSVRLPPQTVLVPGINLKVEAGYLFGLLIFAFTVIAYTTYGGFWAVTWTDVLEGVVMLVGVLIMAVLAVRAVPALDAGGETLTGLAAATERLRQQDAELVHGPGPKNFLPLGMAFSFFCMWSLMAAGQPSGMVRLMSFKDTPSLRRALMLVVGYYFLTYLALVIIFVCARAIFPTEYLKDIGSEGIPDSIMPAMARHLTKDAPWLGGILLAAPYAAIMSTVAAFLLMISSSLVRDIFQRSIYPSAPDWAIKFGSYLVTAVIGIIVCIFALRPPVYLQYIIVFTGAGQGCSFLVPMLLTLFWKRATKQGMIAGMLGGLVAVVGLYAAGWLYAAGLQPYSTRTPPNWALWLGYGAERLDAFAPLYVGGVDPLIWGLLASTILSVGVSLLTKPDLELARRFFPSEKEG